MKSEKEKAITRKEKIKLAPKRKVVSDEEEENEGEQRSSRRRTVAGGSAQRGRSRHGSKGDKEPTDDNSIKAMLAEMNAKLQDLPTRSDLKNLDQNLTRDVAGIIDTRMID